MIHNKTGYAFNAGDHSHETLYEDVVPVLKILSAEGFSLGVISNTTKPGREESLNNLGIKLKQIVIKYANRGKPNASIFLSYQPREGTKRVYYVGNNPMTDTLSEDPLRSSGLLCMWRSIGIVRPHVVMVSEKGKNFDFYVSSMYDIPGLIMKDISARPLLV